MLLVQKVVKYRIISLKNLLWNFWKWIIKRIGNIFQNFGVGQFSKNLYFFEIFYVMMVRTKSDDISTHSLIFHLTSSSHRGEDVLSLDSNNLYVSKSNSDINITNKLKLSVYFLQDEYQIIHFADWNLTFLTYNNFFRWFGNAGFIFGPCLCHFLTIHRLAYNKFLGFVISGIVSYAFINGPEKPRNWPGKGSEMTRKWPEKARNRSRNSQKMIRKFSKKWRIHGLEKARNSTRNGPKMLRIGSEKVLKFSGNGPEMVQKWLIHGPKKSR